MYLCSDECVSLEEFRQNLQRERGTGGSSHCGLFICVFFLVFGDTPQGMGGSPLYAFGKNAVSEIIKNNRKYI